MKIRLNGVVCESIVDGVGIRYVVFTQGCFHNCLECHNEDTHDINGGYLHDIQKIIDEIKENPLLDGVTFSGGEPFLQAKELFEIAKQCRDIGLNIWIYSGFLYEEILENTDYMELLKICDVLVDGKFVASEKSYELQFSGSKNQRVIDVKKSLENGAVELYI